MHACMHACHGRHVGVTWAGVWLLIRGDTGALTALQKSAAIESGKRKAE